MGDIILIGGISSSNTYVPNFNIIVKFQDIEINSLDIDFEIFKYSDSQLNKCRLGIWNLSDTVYQSLLDSNEPVEVYTKYDNLCLLFYGYVDKDKTIKQDGSKLAVDVLSRIVINDGFAAYKQGLINKNYREKVTSTRIIKDCISAMQIGIGKFSENLPEKQYDSYKAKGMGHTVLRDICEPLGIKFCIQNNHIQVISPDDKFDGDSVFVLDASNALKPDKKGDGHFIVTTNLMTCIKPNDIVRCELDGFNGSAIVDTVHSSGNNYGALCFTEIGIKAFQG